MKRQNKSVVATAHNAASSLRSGRLYPAVPHFKRRGEVGPIGHFLRVWRGDAFQDGDTVTVDVSGRKPLPLNLRVDGKDAEQGGALQPASRPGVEGATKGAAPDGGRITA